MPSPHCSLDELNRINEEIERFDISDNADRLEEIEGVDIERLVEKQIFSVICHEMDLKASYHKGSTGVDLLPPSSTYSLYEPSETSVIKLLPVKVKQETMEAMES